MTSAHPHDQAGHGQFRHPAELGVGVVGSGRAGTALEAYSAKYSAWCDLQAESERLASEASLSPDEVAFLEAQLAKLDAGTPYEWALWQFTVKVPEAGVLNVACKAVDENGSEQPSQRDPNRLDGYANNTIEQVHYLIE